MDTTTRHDVGDGFWRLPPYSVEATFVSLSETVDWGLANYDIPKQWRDTQGGGVRVAVLDTGIETSHPDLAGSVDDARDFTGSRYDCEDRVGHGTHVAGTIGARRNDQGVVGVAPECRLLVGKVLGDDGSGSGQSVAAGLDWARDAGADIISMSLGSSRPDQDIKDAIGRAVDAGMFVVCAAGNDGRPDSVNYPARWPETLGIGAVDRHGRVARFSSRGDQVDVCAPGQDVLSAYLDGGYAKLSGTSMATPFVSGVVALLVAKHRDLGGATPIDTQAQLVDHLCRTATDAGPQGKDPNYGYGLINPDSVLAIAEGGDNDTPFEIGPLRVNGVEGTFVFVPR